MKALLLSILTLFSLQAFGYASRPVVDYKTVGDLTFKRQRVSFNHDEANRAIIVSYHQWVEDGSSEVVVPAILRSYSFTGSYYYELSLASSGATPIGHYLGAAIDARLATPGEIQDAIEAGRAVKDAEMALLGYTPD